MTDVPDTRSLRSRRWGETVLLLAALPGAVAAFVVGMLVLTGYFNVQRELARITNLFALLIVSTPMLVVVGAFTLVAGTLAAPFLPGRLSRKVGALVLGALAWGIAGYSLSLPGIIELP